MPLRLVAFSIAIVLSFGTLRAQRNPPPHPDLQGTWNGGTMTPLERPPEFKNKTLFTAEEAAEYVRTALFKPFRSTKEAGLGIGAYESYQYVRELGGSVAVDSEPGRGTVMTISLPLFDAHQTSALQMASAK